MLLWKVAASGSMPGGDGSQMDDGVKPRVAVVDAEDCVHNLAVVLQVHQHQAGALFTGAVKVQHLVPFIAEPSHDAPAELSTSACHSNSHLKLLYASRVSGTCSVQD